MAENTVACMQSAGTGKHPYEIWVMYQTKSLRKTSRLVSANARSKNIDLFPEPFDYTQGKLRQRVTIISTWRYPGVSPIGEPPPIPEEVWEELNKSG